ncbi:MAG: alpha/beta hydrolase [Verrucomicrobia bacterium]|nr:alpha/beta hydrolase [Verrucomicrobiota bacterium]
MKQSTSSAARFSRNLLWIGCLLGATTLPLTALADEVSIIKKTYTYKSFANSTNSLQADVYRSADEKVKPVVIFIHGGALMMGGRGASTRPGSLFDVLLKAGYAVVSIDYRLAPQVKLPAILEDLEDACNWVHEKGSALFHIDPKEIVVMGQSAGGYLTQVAGYRVKPRPKALVSFWGYGDITGKWYGEPDAFYRTKPLVSKEDAWKPGGNLYLYCRQNGLWPKIVAGLDPVTQSKAFDPFCPVRNVTRDYPPTLLIHGTKDTDVPYELSVMMDKELTAKGVKHEFITIPDGGHGFGRNDAEIAARTYEKMVQFLKQF